MLLHLHVLNSVRTLRGSLFDALLVNDIDETTAARATSEDWQNDDEANVVGPAGSD